MDQQKLLELAAMAQQNAILGMLIMALILLAIGLSTFFIGDYLRIKSHAEMLVANTEMVAKGRSAALKIVVCGFVFTLLGVGATMLFLKAYIHYF